MTSLDLFDWHEADTREALGSQAWVLRAYALPFVEDLLAGIAMLEQKAGFRRMMTPAW